MSFLPCIRGQSFLLLVCSLPLHVRYTSVTEQINYFGPGHVSDLFFCIFTFLLHSICYIIMAFTIGQLSSDFFFKVFVPYRTEVELFPPSQFSHANERKRQKKLYKLWHSWSHSFFSFLFFFHFTLWHIFLFAHSKNKTIIIYGLKGSQWEM